MEARGDTGLNPRWSYGQNPIRPPAQDRFQLGAIDPSENSMDRRLAGTTTLLDSEELQPTLPLIITPLRNRLLRLCSVHHRQAGKRQDRLQLVSFALRISEILHFRERILKRL